MLRLAAALLSISLVGCGGEEEAHPWLAIPESYPHQVLESTGIGGGQLVIALDPATTPEQALEVGRIVLDQAPTDITLNARIYNDVNTARNWRTVDEQWTNEHLLVLARRTADGDEELRWVGPETGGTAPVPTGGEPDTTLEADTALAP